MVPGQPVSEVMSTRSCSHETHTPALHSAPAREPEASSRCRCRPHWQNRRQRLINSPRREAASYSVQSRDDMQRWPELLRKNGAGSPKKSAFYYLASRDRQKELQKHYKCLAVNTERGPKFIQLQIGRIFLGGQNCQNR